MAKKQSRSQQKKMSPGQVILTIALLAGISLGVYFVGDQLGLWTFGQEPTPTPTVETFDLQVMDGVNGEFLDNDAFSYTLYGTDDLDDWLEFEVIETGSSIDNIKDSDLEDYNNYVVAYTGDHEHDDDIFGEDHDIGNRAYYQRWAVIDPNGGLQTLIAYQTPESCNAFFFHANNFTLVDLTSHNLTYATNFSMMVGCAVNESTEDRLYAYGVNYQNEIPDQPNVILNFNGSVQLAEISGSGMAKDRVNSTAIRFSFNQLGPVPQSFEFAWDDSVDDLEIISWELEFGETSLATAS